MATNQQATKTALVTGAFSGIGLATALRLAQDGWLVYAAGRNILKNGELIKQSQTLGVQIKSIVMDVTNESSIQTAIDQIAQESGRLDLLVNNAGGGVTGAVTDASNHQIRQLFETNVIGVLAVTRLALPLMLRHQQGRVINLSSVLGRVVFPGMGIYAATKFAMEGFSDAMRLEFKILGPDFHVILIEPGFIKTHFADNSSNVENATQTTPYGSTYSTVAANTVQAGIENGPSPKIVADVVAKAARERNPKSRYGVTSTAKIVMFLRRVLPNRAFDSVMFNISGIKKYIATQQATNKPSAAKLTIS